ASAQAMSLYGLAPCEAGRCLGWAGRARFVKGRAVNDSTEWQRTSKPLQATTLAGMVRVTVGSMRPRTGRIRLDTIPVFACIDVRSKIAIGVHSEPVPEVVGTAISGFRGPGTGFALP